MWFSFSLDDIAAVFRGFPEGLLPLSSVLGARACRDHVARWVANEALGGRSFEAWEGTRGWADSLSVFRRVGADVRPMRHDSDRGGVAEATIGSATCPLPFVVRVRYAYGLDRSGAHTESGEWVFLAGPGIAKRLALTETELRTIDECDLDDQQSPSWGSVACREKWRPGTELNR
jgi:hypothetical protein